MIGFSFLHPGLLWGLGLASVPVIIHFLNRRRFRRVPWAAMEFLLAAMRRNRRRMLIEELLLLLLRVAAVVLLVLLAARPLSSGSGLLATLAGDRGIHHVVVLDDSASMGQAVGGRNLFNQATTALEDLLAGLQSRRKGDRVTLLLSSRPDEPLFSGRPLSSDAIALAREITANARPTGLCLKPEALLERITRNLTTYSGPDEQKVTLYLVSDFRRIDWRGDEDGSNHDLTRYLKSLDESGIETWFIATAGQPGKGLGITAIEAIHPLQTAGIPVELQVRIRNQGTTTHNPGRAKVTADGRVTPLKPTPSLAPGEEATIPFRVLFAQPGFHQLKITIPGDDLPVDNQRHLALHIREAARVLVIGEAGREELEGPGFYLTSAIDPGQIATGFQADQCPPAKAAARDLSLYDCVILAGVSTPHPDLATKLLKFTRAGGGLLLFTSPQVVPPAWNKALGQLLPYPIGNPRTEKENPPAAKLTESKTALTARAHGFFQTWLQQGVFAGHTTQAGDLRENAMVVARLHNSDKSPLFSLCSVGKGRVFLAAISADSTWSGWVGDPVFPLFIQEAVTWALREKPLHRWNKLCGDAIAIPRDRQRDKNNAQLLVPGATALVSLRGTRDGFAHSETQSPGIYEFRISTSDTQGQRRTLRAVNINPAEGLLELTSEQDFNTLYPQARIEWVAAEKTGTMALAGKKDNAWRVIAALLLLVLLLETGMARRLARGRIT